MLQYLSFSYREPQNIKRCSRVLWHLICRIKSILQLNDKILKAVAGHVAWPSLCSVGQSPEASPSEVSAGSHVRELYWEVKADWNK